VAKMNWDEALGLDDSLASLSEFFVTQPGEIELLSGGLSNRCWKLTDAQGRHYVWRPATSISQAFGVSRANEYYLLRALSHYAFSPQAVLLNKSGLLVEWLEGHVMTGAVSSLDLMTTLATIHQVEINDKPIQKFNLPERVDLYWMQLDTERLDPQVEALYRRFREPAYTPNQLRTLCHLDLGDYNMIRTPRGIGVIDWEYSAIGDPRMDLAMTCQVAGLDVSDSVLSYCQIRGIEEPQVWLEGVQEWLPRVQLIGMLWFYLGYQLWGDELYRQRAEQLKQSLLA